METDRVCEWFSSEATSSTTRMMMRIYSSFLHWYILSSGAQHQGSLASRLISHVHLTGVIVNLSSHTSPHKVGIHVIAPHSIHPRQSKFGNLIVAQGYAPRRIADKL